MTKIYPSILALLLAFMSQFLLGKTSHPPQLKAISYKSSLLTIEGSNFDLQKNKMINFYINKKYSTQLTVKKNNFSKILEDIEETDTVTAKIIDFYQKGKHKEIILKHDPQLMKKEQPLFVLSKTKKEGILRIEGSQFNSKSKINIYVNKEFESTFQMKKGSFFKHKLEATNPTDRISIKVIDFYAPGLHLERDLVLPVKKSNKLKWFGLAATAVTAGIIAVIIKYKK